MDELPLRLGHVAQELEHNVRYQRPGQIPALPGIQQRHVQHDNGRPAGFGDVGPLLQDIIVISAQPVNAFDNQNIPRPKQLHKGLIQGPIKVFPGLLLNHNILCGHPKLLQRDQLPVLVLRPGRYAGITIHNT